MWDHGVIDVPLTPPPLPTDDGATAGKTPRAPSVPTPRSLGLVRLPKEGLTGGVAAGIGARLGVDPLIVRLSFAVLASAAGAGALLYVLLLLWLPEAGDESAVHREEPTVRHALALGLIAAGVLLLLRAAGVWLTDGLAWSVGLAALGSGVVWTRASEEERTRWHAALDKAVGDRALPDARSFGSIRLVIGACLVLAGAVTFLANSEVLSGSVTAIADVVVASVVTLVGVGLVIGPWLQRQAGQLAQERRERIRSEERADMAAHLHDSVLQTLALIQRAGSQEEVSRLARSQERELRNWLFGRSPADAPTTLSQAVQDMAGRVEDRFGVPVDVVLAGDMDLNAALVAVTEAAGEAMANAARHSGAPRVDVFVEVEANSVTVFVRDEGSGFDSGGVGHDRWGISHSIQGRMRRHGGSVMIQSQPGEGTEVELSLPLYLTEKDEPDD